MSVMEWSGGAPAPPASNGGMGEYQTEHRHVQQINRDHGHLGRRYWQRGAIALRQNHAARNARPTAASHRRAS
jgi:hypothetical protein